MEEKKTLRILHIEDNPGDARLVKEMLSQSKLTSFEIEHFERVKPALERLKQGGIDVVLSDLKVPDSQGLDTFQRVYEQAPSIPIVLITGTYEEEELALEALRRGAQDYLKKDVLNSDLLVRAIRYAIERKQLEEAVKERTQDLQSAQEASLNMLEDLRETNDKLEKANLQLSKLDQLKSDFVSVVSHELRTPLSIMKEGVSLVLDKVTGNINQKTEDTLSMVFANINRLARLITDLLDISKIEAGKIQIKKSFVDIRQLIKEVAEKWRLESDKKQQELLIHASEGEVNIYLDPDKITQVLNNLFSNAIKFTPEKGRIKVELKDKKEEVEISVSDNGIGFTAEDIPKVFEKFQQFSRPVGSGAKGTGLGLAISRELVTIHEGIIKVESKPGAGSEFIFTLPKKDSEAVFKEHINNSIKEALGKGAVLSLISINILDFHRLNNELGFDKAHGFLKALERIINETLRRKADIVVRGTGEVIIILFDANKTGAKAVKQRIEEAIKNYLASSQDDLIKGISLNIGLASYPEEAKSEIELLNQARGIIRA